ncbi:sensor domain-containing phosphodiesterase [Mixta intestinalis]|uniref:Cyclic di-GMP phosphodiesterase YfgF n=1 Tax=Mixta intestinalis TaxID=1615494 RepID=A0A6P1PZG1_9GAMM|nr:EAL domain-containing protein [Mixta intestinalis]QHM72030.1 Cyclic di-GMP phosphodiesterase YfgF [Mixta intestinalis]
MFTRLKLPALRRFRCSWWGVPLWLALLLMPLSSLLSVKLTLPDGPIYLLFLPITLNVALLMVFDWAALPGIALALLWRYITLFSPGHALLTCIVFISGLSICWLGYRIWAGRHWGAEPGMLQLGVMRLFWIGFFLPTLLVFLMQITVTLNAVPATNSIFNRNPLTLRTLINYQAILLSCVAIMPFYYMVIRCFRHPGYLARQFGLLRQQIADSVSTAEIKIWLVWLVLLVMLLMVLHSKLENQLIGDFALLLVLPTMLWSAVRFGFLFTALVWALVLIALYQFRAQPDISLHLAVISTNLLVWTLIIYFIAVSGVRQRQLIQKSRQAALIDPIIDLPNLRALKNMLAQQASSTLCFLRIPDIDRLSRTWGLDLRIEYKRRLAAHLQPLLHSNETVYHLPGFDLALRLNKSTHEERIQQICARLDGYSLRWKGLPLQPDIGISYCHVVPPVNHLPGLLGELSEMAEVSLHSHQPESLQQDNTGAQRQIREKLALLNEVQQALDNERFIMMAQRIEGLRGDDYHDLLLRLIDSRGEQVSPERFLPVVQEFGLTWEIDRWVLNHALSFIDRSREHLPAARFAVNIHAVNLCRPFFLSELERLLKQHQVEPWQLILVISETSGAVESLAGQRTINRLRQLGCRIAIEHFGVSYASYLQLTTLEADMLKIDGGFVHNMLNSPLNYQIVESICRVARLKRMQIVAESVESQAVAAALRALGIDYLQGDAISEPQPLTMLADS